MSKKYLIFSSHLTFINYYNVNVVLAWSFDLLFIWRLWCSRRSSLAGQFVFLEWFDQTCQARLLRLDWSSHNGASIASVDSNGPSPRREAIVRICSALRDVAWRRARFVDTRTSAPEFNTNDGVDIQFIHAHLHCAWHRTLEQHQNILVNFEYFSN